MTIVTRVTSQTPSVLLCMLVRWCEKYQLPPVLYLQLDNCVKENKNQYILWLLALLVELKIFEKVKSCVLLPAFILEEVGKISVQVPTSLYMRF